MGRRTVLLDVGDFSTVLDGLTPHTKRPNLDGPFGGFSLYVVTPGRVPIDAVDVAGLLAQASYTGIIRGTGAKSDGTIEVSGIGALALMGDEDSKGFDPIDTSGGGTITTRPFYDGANTSVVNAAVDRGQGITKHASIPSSATPTASYHVDSGATGLDILRAGCRGAFATWREFYVDPQLALHADLATALFRAGHVILTRDFEGPYGDRWGIPADLSLARDLEDWTRSVKVNNGSGISGTATIGSNPYFAPDGAALHADRTIESSAPPSNAAAGQVASTQLGRFDAPANTLTVRTTSRKVSEHVMAGDWLWAYDPTVGVYDDDEQVSFAGRTIAPLKSLRCMSLTCRNEEGEGHYMVSNDGATQTITDWSDHVIPESPGADIEVGQITRTLSYQPLAKATT